MAASTERAVDSEALARRAPVLGGAVLLAAVLVVGGVSLVKGPPGFEARLPTYALAGSVGFGGALLALRNSPRDSRSVLQWAVATGLGGFAVATLGTEGIIYGLLTVASATSLYAVAGGLVVCGLVYWSYRSWHTVEDLTRPW